MAINYAGGCSVTKCWERREMFLRNNVYALNAHCGCTEKYCAANELQRNDKIR